MGKTATSNTTKKTTKPKAASKSKIAPKSKIALNSKIALKRAPVKKSAKTPDPKRAGKVAAPPESEIRQATMKAAQYALEKKATDIHVLDLTAITSMTDYFIIATGSSDRQVKAIAENVVSEMRDTEGVTAWRSEGWDSLQWIIIDFVDFVVHVFQEESRKYYNMERLWADAPMTEVKDEEPAKKPTRRKKNAETLIAPKDEAQPAIKVVSGFKRVRKADVSHDLS